MVKLFGSLDLGVWGHGNATFVAFLYSFVNLEDLTVSF